MAFTVKIVKAVEVQALRDATVAHYDAQYRCSQDEPQYPSLAYAKGRVEAGAVAVAVYNETTPLAWCLIEPATGRFEWLCLCADPKAVETREGVAALIKAVHERVGKCWGCVANARVRELIRERRPEIQETGVTLLWR